MNPLFISIYSLNRLIYPYKVYTLIKNLDNLQNFKKEHNPKNLNDDEIENIIYEFLNLCEDTYRKIDPDIFLVLKEYKVKEKQFKTVHSLKNRNDIGRSYFITNTALTNKNDVNTLRRNIQIGKGFQFNSYYTDFINSKDFYLIKNNLKKKFFKKQFYTTNEQFYKYYQSMILIKAGNENLVICFFSKNKNVIREKDKCIKYLNKYMKSRVSSFFEKIDFK